MTDFDKRKLAINAPCVYMTTDRLGHQRRAAPCVDCDMKCSTCGWNPEEMDRRKSFGFTRNAWGGKKIKFKGVKA